jgi:hypothetical protein
MPRTGPPESVPASPTALRWLQGSLAFAVGCFGWLRFSDNTVDNDLWGHVLYGQRYWLDGEVRGLEIFSWTAYGHPIVNHEYLAELLMGGIHRLGGGTGLWLYMMAMAFVTVLIAFRAGRHSSESRTPAPAWASWVLLAASTNFIALGFAVRPQLFTTLGLVLELVLLRRIVNGKFLWALALPPLIALWGNAHGGVLAGVLIIFLMAGVESLRTFWPRLEGGFPSATQPDHRRLIIYWSLALVAALALLLNPWGPGMVEWNVSAVLRPRPQIHEWQRTAFSAANAPFYVVSVVSLLAWAYSRQPRKAWEGATLLFLALMGALHQRHAPLFGLANLMFTPVHLADAARRLGPSCRSLLTTFSRPVVQVRTAIVLLGAGVACLVASFTAPKERPFTLEVERYVYPVTAVEFIQANQLFGKTITFFDWGQQNIWELPHNPVSFDGRFDTGYPQPVIAAHWDFYSGQAMRPEVKWNEADLALLPTDGGGARLLAAAGWRVVYRDPLATVLVRNDGKHASFRSVEGPLLRGADALDGRKAFPDALPVLATPAAHRPPG